MMMIEKYFYEVDNILSLFVFSPARDTHGFTRLTKSLEPTRRLDMTFIEVLLPPCYPSCPASLPCLPVNVGTLRVSECCVLTH